jgi:hypothetical protein
VITDWMDDAACTGAPLEVFFPVTSQYAWGRARTFCARCPVLEQCRTWNDGVEKGVISERQMAGFYAGETPDERVARRSSAA